MYTTSDTSSVHRWNQCVDHLYRSSPWIHLPTLLRRLFLYQFDFDQSKFSGLHFGIPIQENSFRRYQTNLCYLWKILKHGSIYLNIIKYSLSENSNYRKSKNYNENFYKHNSLYSSSFQEIVVDYYWFVLSYQHYCQNIWKDSHILIPACPPDYFWFVMKKLKMFGCHCSHILQDKFNQGIQLLLSLLGFFNDPSGLLANSHRKSFMTKVILYIIPFF